MKKEEKQKDSFRIGVLGGSFDPIHYAHLYIAEESFKQFQLDRVYFVPVRIPPHKNKGSSVSDQDRLNMIQSVIRGHPYFFLSTIETDRSGVSYSIDTVRELYRILPISGRIHWILGEDLLLSLPEWKNFSELKTLVHWIVFARDSSSYKEDRTENLREILNRKLETKKENILKFRDQHGLSLDYLSSRHYRVSSSMIRACIEKGEQIDSLVPELVLNYIARQNLYSLSSL